MRIYPVGVVACAAVALVVLASGDIRAADWPMYGRDATRNPASPEKNAPTDWQVEFPDAAGKVAAARNVKWKADLGSTTFGSPVVAGGLVWVCTNNERPRDPNFAKDMGCLMCFDERDGRFRWQHLTPRIGDRHVDSSVNSVGSPPLVEGERLWFITNRWEVVCLDIGPLLKGAGEPKEAWKLDLRRDLGVAPFASIMGPSLRCAIGASYQGRIYVITGNGFDETRTRVPAPDAPSLVCLEKDTGKVLWKDNSPGGNIIEGQWSSPLVAEVGGTAQVIAPQGDGWVRSFDATSGRLLWQFDANPKGSAYPMTRNLLIAPPVFYEGRVYVATGRDPENGTGNGVLWCIDPTRAGDVSEELDDGPLGDAAPGGPGGGPGRPRKGKPNPNSVVVWKFGTGLPAPRGERVPEQDRMHRTMSGVAAADGLVVAVDFAGYVHCLDARTGRQFWGHDLETEVWAAPLVCDGKVYAATYDGAVRIFALSREQKTLANREFGQPIHSAPIFANGVLYVTTQNTLYAIAANAAGPGDAGRKPRADAGARDAPAAGPTVGPTAERWAGDAMYVPTPQDVVDRMLELAAVRKDDVVYDLGCGDGRIVVTAASRYGCRAAGFDIDPQCVRLSGENVRRHNVTALVDIARKDLFTVDLGGATVVTLYLGRDVNRRLVPQLEKLRPGSRVVSHDFDIEGFEPDEVTEVVSAKDDTKHVLYLWKTPLKKKAAKQG